MLLTLVANPGNRVRLKKSVLSKVMVSSGELIAVNVPPVSSLKLAGEAVSSL